MQKTFLMRKHAKIEAAGLLLFFLVLCRVMSGFQEELFTYYTGLSPEWGENWTE